MGYYMRLYKASKNEKTTGCENLFTKIIAHVLEDEDMLITFLSKFTDIEVKNLTDLNVKTQEPFEASN